MRQVHGSPEVFSLHLDRVPGQPRAGQGQLFNVAVKRAQRCSMCTWESCPTIGAICCTLTGHEKKEVGEQDLLLHGERVRPWKRRGLNVLLHPQGSGLFQDAVTYMPFVIQLSPSPPSPPQEKGAAKEACLLQLVISTRW